MNAQKIERNKKLKLTSHLSEEDHTWEKNRRGEEHEWPWENISIKSLCCYRSRGNGEGLAIKKQKQDEETSTVFKINNSY